MRFDELDRRMRSFETALDRYLPEDQFVVVRLDGRGFTKLTRERHAFAAPYDERFRDLMLQTAQHLMTCGFDVAYAYSQSDEISLLLRPGGEIFRGKERKLLTILAGEASGRFSVALGDAVAFDARVSLLPTVEAVVDYFRWRMEDSARNCLNACGYWALRRQGDSPANAAGRLKGLSDAVKQNLLRELGVDPDRIPPWQRYGCGVYWGSEMRRGLDPRTGQECNALRRQMITNLTLPTDNDADAMIQRLLQADTVLPEGVSASPGRPALPDRIPAYPEDVPDSTAAAITAPGRSHR